MGCCFSAEVEEIPEYSDTESIIKSKKTRYSSIINKKRKVTLLSKSGSGEKKSTACMSDQEFEALQLESSTNRFDDERINHITQLVRKKDLFLSCHQLATLMKTMAFSSQQLTLAQKLLLYVVDLQENNQEVLQCIQFYKDRMTLSEQINKQIL
ncbi:cytosol aminopeptidase [Acrasis kona]|uniref:Cytosol aminopeptidase n=1 Tax=Acrasis kona TaxID=1008807 RepID=A0AAW2YW98_9EUKA